MRSAVSHVLALEAGERYEILDEVSTYVVIWVMDIVGISLLVNGFLIKPLVSASKLNKANKAREDFLDFNRLKHVVDLGQSQK